MKITVDFSGDFLIYYHTNYKARLAQLVVRLIRNEQVGGSSPLPGSSRDGGSRSIG